MKKKKIVTILCIPLLFFQALILNLPLVVVSSEIPEGYYQYLDLDGIYIYNITKFGDKSEWINFTDESEGYWATNIGGQIIINFTGFYGDDPDESIGDVFSGTNMSWMDIDFYKLISGSLQLNFSLYNASNSEIAQNLRLGFSGFRSGFLIAINQTDMIKANAKLEANGKSGLTAYLSTEETHNFLFFKFEQYGASNNQKTTLVYDKKTGLLVTANTSIGSYQLSLSLTNYSLDIDKEYVYNVEKFDPGWAIWTDLWGGYKDIYATGSGRGWIKVNFTGYYSRDPLIVWDEPFMYTKPGRPWQDIKILYDGDYGVVTTMQLDNVSNSECASTLAISFPGFLSGFLMPKINNNTFDITAEVWAATGYLGDEREFTYDETDLTIDMWFKCGGDYPQETRLIYEKFTGLLMYVKTELPGFKLELIIDDFTLPAEESGETPPLAIFSFPLLILIGISIISVIIVIVRMKKEGFN